MLATALFIQVRMSSFIDALSSLLSLPLLSAGSLLKSPVSVRSFLSEVLMSLARTNGDLVELVDLIGLLLRSRSSYLGFFVEAAVGLLPTDGFLSSADESRSFFKLTTELET